MLKIALVDARKLVAKGVEGILEDEDDLVVVGVFPNVNKSQLVTKAKYGK